MHKISFCEHDVVKPSGPENKMKRREPTPETKERNFMENIFVPFVAGKITFGTHFSFFRGRRRRDKRQSFLFSLDQRQIGQTSFVQASKEMRFSLFLVFLLFHYFFFAIQDYGKRTLNSSGLTVLYEYKE